MLTLTEIIDDVKRKCPELLENENRNQLVSMILEKHPHFSHESIAVLARKYRTVQTPQERERQRVQKQITNHPFLTFN